MADRSVNVVANKFEYEFVGWPEGPYFRWRIILENDYEIKGTANSVKQAHRRAKRAYKRYLRMERVINP